MKIIQILGVMLSLLMYAHGAKVTWGADGKPIIEGSSKSFDGCTEGGVKDLSMDENRTVKG